ncbi:MAG: hypothetical protein WCC87_16095 [Candidatus Korobacteraceae bacterium]
MEKQIPRGLKPARDDKIKCFMAQLKLRPFKIPNPSQWPENTASIQMALKYQIHPNGLKTPNPSE